MAKENDKEQCSDPKYHKPHHGKIGGGIYGLVFIGAAVYFVQHSDTFWLGVLGVLKALVWPAVVIYKILEVLKF